MSEKLQVAVGDTVIVTTPRRRGVTERECTVTKVGRKYVYVTGYAPDYGFDLVTGLGNSNGSPDVLYTQAGWAATRRRSDIERRLRADHNICSAQGSRFSQNTDTLQAVLDLLDSLVEEVDRG